MKKFQQIAITEVNKEPCFCFIDTEKSNSKVIKVIRVKQKDMGLFNQLTGVKMDVQQNNTDTLERSVHTANSDTSDSA